MEKIAKDNRGVALIVTILVISLIVVLTLEFNRSMRSELYAAANLRDGIRLGCLARSGFNYALAVLFQDGLESDFDSPHEAWAGLEVLSASSALVYEDVRFSLRIIDHSGKIPVNQLVNEDGAYNTRQKDLLTRFLALEEFGLDPEEVRDILEAIKDWIDPDDEAEDFGAENAYYQSLERPYSCKNSPFESVNELLLVKGISRELFYGTEGNPGISGYLTVTDNGTGKININSADPLVLRCLSDQLEMDMVDGMIEYRKDDDNDLKDPKWYQRVPEIPADVILDPDLITTSSTYFEIESGVFKGAMSKKVTGLVKRDRQAKKFQLLSWEIE